MISVSLARLIITDNTIPGIDHQLSSIHVKISRYDARYNKRRVVPHTRWYCYITAATLTNPIPRIRRLDEEDAVLVSHLIYCVTKTKIFAYKYGTCLLLISINNIVSPWQLLLITDRIVSATHSCKGTFSIRRWYRYCHSPDDAH